ncbi:hypothetical protein [Micromonospora sp. DT47]|uniref:hypothetical protein n=1 Tax=Micromonospora sp. DT47 TaxID=3393431 RepID=UPI003CECB511
MDGTGSGWRARWARRESERRRDAYEAAEDSWLRRDADLRQLCAQAEESEGWVEAPAGLPVALDDGEVVFAVLPAAELIEVAARHTAGLPTPELTVVPVERTARPPRLPTKTRVADAGMAVVTDRRILLLGRGGTREWTYPQLSGIAHDPAAPFTLLHTHDAAEMFGIRVPSAAASDFRLRLTLAYADAIGERDAVLDRLDEAVAAHWRTRPPTPAAATPAQAPASARLARPSLVAAVAVAIALAAVVGAVRWSAPQRPEAVVSAEVGAGAAPVGSTAPEADTAIGTAASSAAATPGTGTPGTTAAGATGSGPAAGTTAAGPGVSAPPGGPPVTPPGRPTPTTSSDPSTPSPTASPGSPSPTPGDRCGAPENPYGYNYCGGSYVDDPASDVCSYFDCVDTFWNGKGYMVQCQDGMVSMTGVQRGPCAEHSGTWRTVYDA